MAKVVLDRVALLLAFGGLFVAGVLSVGHWFAVEIPCGIGMSGCNIIAQHPSSYWFGIPVAFFGVLMYAALLGLTALRSFTSERLSRKLLKVSLALAIAGAVVSACLQYYSFVVIKELCTWCLASAAIIVTLAFVLGYLVQRPSEGEPARNFRADFATLSFFGLALVASLGFQAYSMLQVPEMKVNLSVLGLDPIGELIPEHAHSIGPADAEITIVEFGDLNCPLCKAMHIDIKKEVAKSNGKLRLVFRHFPLVEGKPLSLPAAILSEFAAEKGKFWQFLDAVYAIEDHHIEDIEVFYDVIRGLGLSVRDASEIIEDTNTAAFDRVYKDRNAADRLGLQVTPTYFIVAKGQPVVGVTGSHLFRKLHEPRFASLIEGDAK